MVMGLHLHGQLFLLIAGIPDGLLDEMQLVALPFSPGRPLLRQGPDHCLDRRIIPPQKKPREQHTADGADADADIGEAPDILRFFPIEIAGDDQGIFQVRYGRPDEHELQIAVPGRLGQLLLVLQQLQNFVLVRGQGQVGQEHPVVLVQHQHLAAAEAGYPLDGLLETPGIGHNHYSARLPAA
ncbi:hypothetical protein D3C75_841730 [compost metagenome]